MDALVTVASPFLVSWITSLTKNHVLTGIDSVTLVRFVAAVLSLAAAVGTLLIGGQVPDLTGLVNAVMLAFFNFVGATGIWHLVKN